MQIIFDISKLSGDILFFTTSELNFFEVDESLFTGSSIMPQKRNVDVAELLRSKVNIIEGYLLQIFNTVVNLPSGYNRDFQDIKRPFIESINLTKNVLNISEILVKNIKPRKDILLKSMTPDLYATHVAYQMVKEGVTFRDAYKKIDDILDNLPSFDPQEVLKMSKHIGGTANLQNGIMKNELAKYKKILLKETKNYNKIIFNFKNKK
jgi:argininosuccinate lyase